MVFLLLGREIYDIFVVQINDTILHLAVRSFDETKVVNLCIDAKRRDKSDVRTFRTFNRAETAIVSIVYVTHLETCTLARQATRAKGRQTALVRNFSKRVGLVHKLRQRVGSEERVDDA